MGSFRNVVTPPNSSGSAALRRKRSTSGLSRSRRIPWFLGTSIMACLVYNNIRGVFQLLNTSGSSGATTDENFLFAPTHDVYQYYVSSSSTADEEASDEPKNAPLRIYWLHNTQDVKARQRLEDSFASLRLSTSQQGAVPAQGLITRIPYVTVEEVDEMYVTEDSIMKTNTTTGNKLILKNNVTLTNTDRLARPKSGDYSFDDARRLVTHLMALDRAYKAGHERVLIIQDDALLTQAFFDHFRNYTELAPQDWTVLQWTTENLATLEQNLQLSEPWISWFPDLWGTQAYLINRRGIEAIEHKLIKPNRRAILPSASETSPSPSFNIYTLDDPFWKVLLADELLFSVDQKAYTSTYPWVLTDEIKKSSTRSPLHAHLTSSLPMLPLPSLDLPIRNETVLVFMNIRVTTSKQMGIELARIQADNEALCGIHRLTRCQWIVRIVFTQNFLAERFEDIRKELPLNVHLDIQVTKERFNKFQLLAKHLHNMTQYDLVLLKDNDQRIAGFPWVSFLERKGSSLVAGPLRQAIDESYQRNKIWEKSQHYKFHDAQAWKMKQFQPWSTELYVNSSALQVPFLEMYFNVFDGKFAEWFFSQVLTKNFTQQDSCWGPDLLWCPAAYEYDPSRVPETAPEGAGCALVPLISAHEDTRQIKKDGEAFNLRGYAAVENLRASKPSFARWYNTAGKYAFGVIAWRTLDAIAKQCRAKLMRIVISVPLDFTACIRAGMARSKPA